MKYNFTVVDVNKATFGAIGRGENTDEYYTIDKSNIKEEDKDFFMLGAMFNCDENGIHFSHEVYTEEDIKEIEKRAKEMAKLFGVKR